MVPLWNNDVHLESVLVHELGHLLGLNHNYNSPSSVMWDKLSAGSDGLNVWLHQDDINGINQLYQATISGVVGVEDAIFIYQGPDVIQTEIYFSYSANFIDNDPYGDYLVDGINWEIKALHNDGEYIISQSHAGIFYSLPGGYCWLRDENNNVKGIVEASGTDNTGHFHVTTKGIGISGISSRTTSGTINQNEEWCGSIIVTGDITINNGVTLTVHLYTTVQFNNGTKLIVNGTLNTTRAQFISVNSSSTWEGIQFNSGSNGNINYTNIDDASQGISLNGTGTVTISNSKISNCSGNAVQVINTPNFEISHSNFIDNYISIYVSGSSGTLEYNSLTSNSLGHSIFIDNHSTIDCNNNRITKTGSGQHHGHGIQYGGGSNGELWQNDISYCDWGIGAIWGSSPTSYYSSRNNRITNCNTGITVYRQSYPVFGLSIDYGFSSIYNNTYNAKVGVTYSTYASSLTAQGNWWGSYPPNTTLFSVGAASSFDYVSFLDDDPWAGLAKTSGNTLATVSAGQTDIQATGSDNPLLTGIKLRIDKKYNEAKDFFISYLAEHPDHQQAYVELYNCYSKETANDIIKYFTSLPKEASKDHKLRLSYLYQKEGNIEAAKSVNNSIIKENPNTSLATRAKIEDLYIKLYNENNLDGAVGIFQEVLNNQKLSTPYELTDIEYAIKNFARVKGKSIPEFPGLRSIQQSNEVSSGSSEGYNLTGNFPNPFNPTTIINYSIPAKSNVKISVYDITGALIKFFIFDSQSAGYHKVEWNGTNERGIKVSSGMYIYRMEAVSLDGNAERFVQSRKMILLK